MLELNQQIVFSVKHCHFFFSEVSFTGRVSAREGEIFNEQIRAQLKLYCVRVLEGLYFCLPWMLIISMLTEFPTKKPVLIVLLSHVKKSNSVSAINFPQRKYLFQSHVVRGCFTTPTAAFWGCWEHEHVLSTPCRRLQQEGCWHHLGKAFWSPVGFSFLIRAKDRHVLTWTEQNTSGLPPFFVPATLQV